MTKEEISRIVGLAVGDIESLLENPNLTMDFVAREVRLRLEQAARDIKKLEQKGVSKP